MEINLQTTRVFHETIASNARYVVNRGGGGSSKTVSVLQVLATKFLTEEDKRIVIIRKTLPALRDSTHTLFLEMIENMGISRKIHEEKQYLNYRYKNNEIRFRSLDSADKIKSSEYNYVFLEEATELKYSDYEMLDMYMRKPSKDGKRNQMYLNFNPVSIYHWLKEKLVDRESDLQEIVSTYKDNPFLSDDHRRKLEGLINRDPNLYRVYTLGEWGIDSNLIFTNWQVINNIPFEDVIDIGYGSDFGFNHPSVLMKLYQHKKEKLKLYLDELLYKKNMITSELISRFDVIIDEKSKYQPIYCDSAEPDRIAEIRKAGYNAKKAKKGKNSVKDGIDFMKKFDILIPEHCVNTIKEYQSYCWEVDRDGDPTEKPVDFNNHCIDSSRYVIYTALNKPKLRLRWVK